MRAEHTELETRLADPEVHSDPSLARRHSQRYAELSAIVRAHDEWTRLGEDLQAARELSTRYDFKGTDSAVELGDGTITLTSGSEDRLKAARQVLEEKLVKRKVSLKAVDFGKIEDAAGEYCNVGTTKPVLKGANSFKFSDLQGSCWKPAATNPTGDKAASGLIKIAWQVVTKSGATVPFDYCVSNVRALQ